MAGDIGHVLRDARHSRGVTLSDAARHTGVRETHLAALERDELETYGIDPVYVGGILRTYAEYLHLDAAALLARYRAGGAQPAGHDVRGPALTGATGPTGRHRRGRRNAAAVAGVVLLAAVLAGATVAVLWWQGGQRQTAASAGELATSEPGVAAVATETASSRQSEAGTDTDTVLDIPQSTERPDELTMKLEFTDKVWVRVIVDGRNKLEGIMRPGAVTQFTGKHEIQLRIGVAEAVEFSLNGAWYGNVASNHDGPVNVTCTTDSSCKVTKVG
jgi:cytoskeleton protein RodZ